MCDFGSVKFDKMAVNTDLAQKYFKEKENTFKSTTVREVSTSNSDNNASDGYNTVFFSDYDDSNIVNLNTPRETTEKLLKLAELVEENAETLAQIEYLIRKKSIDDVKNYDIKLILQNLYCGSFNPDWCKYFNYFGDNVKGVVMNAETPLANIAYVAQLLNYRFQIIFATTETAAVSCFFAELCHKVGINSVKVFIIQQDLLPRGNLAIDMASTPTVKKGCVGVITERSDLDSAIDVFIGTTTKYPWKLKHIYVQENIYERFKKAMAWKTGLKSESIAPQDILESLKCDNVHEGEGKTFFIDYAGTPESATGKILVEAYRTTKELIAMVTKNGALFLSLWSSDISEANEIADKVPSTIVWINSYGVFDGPPKTSEAIYREPLKVKSQDKYYVEKNVFTEQKKWSERTSDERRRIIYLAAVEFLKDEKNISQHEDVKKLMIALRGMESEIVAYVKNGRSCIFRSVPNDVIVLSYTEDNEIYLARLLTAGAAVLTTDSEYFALKLSPLIPIYHTRRDKDGVVVPYLVYRSKVIWTNFGTVFAN